MDRDTLDQGCERALLGLVLAVLVYSPLALGAVRPQEFLVVQALTVLILGLWLARLWIKPHHHLLWPWVSWGVLAFMGYALIRGAFADIEYVARQETLRVLVYGCLFLAILNNLHRQETTQIIVMTLLGVGTVIALYGTYQFLAKSEYVWHFVKPAQYFKRGSGPFINPNNFAGYLEMLIPLAVAYAFTARIGHLGKVLIGYAAAAMLAGVAASVSRGGWVATGVGLGVLLLWLMQHRDYRLRALLLMAGLVVAGGLFLAKAEFSAQRQKVFTQEKPLQGVSYRFLIWKPALRMWQDHFWWGVGPGHFDPRYPAYRLGYKHPEQAQLRPGHVHNDYLNTLTDYGLVGAALVLAVWALFFAEVVWSWRRVGEARNDLATKRSNRAALMRGGVTGLLAMLVHAFTEFNLHIPAVAILTVTLMALVSGYFRYGTNAHWHLARWPLRMVLAFGLLLGIVYLGTQTWQGAVETHWLQRAKRLKRDPLQAIAALKHAFAADPKNFQTAFDLGEAYRLQSWKADEGWEDAAREAMRWFQRSIALNPVHAYSQVRYGMCLDWLGQRQDAGPYFERALKLDPHGYYTVAHVGWHYAQLREWAKAKEFFERSLSLNQPDNRIARSYLDIVNRRLAEQSAAP